MLHKVIVKMRPTTYNVSSLSFVSFTVLVLWCDQWLYGVMSWYFHDIFVIIQQLWCLEQIWGIFTSVRPDLRQDRLHQVHWRRHTSLQLQCRHKASIFVWQVSNICYRIFVTTECHSDFFFLKRGEICLFNQLFVTLQNMLIEGNATSRCTSSLFFVHQITSSSIFAYMYILIW